MYYVCTGGRQCPRPCEEHGVSGVSGPSPVITKPSFGLSEGAEQRVFLVPPEKPSQKRLDRRVTGSRNVSPDSETY